jgi:hypothetical protein
MLLKPLQAQFVAIMRWRLASTSFTDLTDRRPQSRGVSLFFKPEEPVNYFLERDKWVYE